MNITIAIPEPIARKLEGHLFQNKLEQGAFLFARHAVAGDGLALEVVESHLVLPEGWAIQNEYHLEMRDEERAKIMRAARQSGLAAIDCHSHPGATDDVWFSGSDRHGIAEFADYARWKLPAQPFAALVWGRSSVDAVAWHGAFEEACPVRRVVIAGQPDRVLVPRGSWFRLLPRFETFGSHRYGK